MAILNNNSEHLCYILPEIIAPGAPELEPTHFKLKPSLKTHAVIIYIKFEMDWVITSK